MSFLTSKNRNQQNPTAINNNLPPMFKIHRDASPDVRLHLPQPPIGRFGMSHIHAGFQQGIQHL